MGSGPAQYGQKRNPWVRQALPGAFQEESTVSAPQGHRRSRAGAGNRRGEQETPGRPARGGSTSSKPAVAAAGPGGEASPWGLCRSWLFCVHGSPEHLPCCFLFFGKKGPSRHQKAMWGVLSLVGGPALRGLPSPVVSPSLTCHVPDHSAPLLIHPLCIP